MLAYVVITQEPDAVIVGVYTCAADAECRRAAEGQDAWVVVSHLNPMPTSRPGSFLAGSYPNPAYRDEAAT